MTSIFAILFFVLTQLTVEQPEVLKDSLKIKKRIKYGILSLIKIKILSL
jgi:hypothetical protein